MNDMAYSYSDNDDLRVNVICFILCILYIIIRTVYVWMILRLYVMLF